MFLTTDYLKSGSPKQIQTYQVIADLGIMKDLAPYQPILCGTIPINICIDSSDLDVIMEVENFQEFEQEILELYGRNEGFSVKRKIIRNRPIIKANFLFHGFEFELFGQDVPVHKQYAYLHMVIEQRLLEEDSSLKEKIRELKRRGYKTEPAFCAILGLNGDPYEELIKFGLKRGFISI